MQILEYEENVHLCLSCDTEFKVLVLNNGGEEMVTAFCPCCGNPLDEDEEEMYDNGDEEF